MAFILNKNLLFSFFKRCLLRANAQVIIHRKNLSMGEVYTGYNLNAQTHTINSPAWSVSANHMLSNFRLQQIFTSG